jgi:hypothetical protein
MSKSERSFEDQSRLRQEIGRRAVEMNALLETLLGREPLFRGQVYEAAPKCGKPTCHCATGEGHHSILVSYLDGETRRTRSIDEQARSQLEPLAASYRRFREARAVWVRLAKEIPDLLNKLEEARTVRVDPSRLKGEK